MNSHSNIIWSVHSITQYGTTYGTLFCDGVTSQASSCFMYRTSLWFCQLTPAELEEILRSHPDIDDAAVVGVPDDRAGEVPRAFVVHGRPDVSEEDVKNFVAAKLSEHKQLKGGVQFLTDIPKSPSGKILRRQLKDVLWTWPLTPSLTTVAQGLSVVACSIFYIPLTISVQFAFGQNGKSLKLWHFPQ